jgi:hypothetical protein
MSSDAVNLVEMDDNIGNLIQPGTASPSATERTDDAGRSSRRGRRGRRGRHGGRTPERGHRPAHGMQDDTQPGQEPNGNVGSGHDVERDSPDIQSRAPDDAAGNMSTPKADNSGGSDRSNDRGNDLVQVETRRTETERVE